MAVLKAIQEKKHSEAAEIFATVQQKIATTSIQAVYNNLNALAENGIIREIKPKGRASLYEIEMDDNHHHVVCRTCDSVVDTGCKSTAPCLTPTQSHGFDIDEAEVIFWGTCPTCKSNQDLIKEIK